MRHLQGFQWAALVVLAVCVWTFAFVVCWALVGWGVSIAVRCYRFAMRNHQPQVLTPAVVERTPVGAGRGWDN